VPMKDPLLSQTEREYGELHRAHLLEQYKLYVEMADRISQRRAVANTFFTSASALLLTVYGAVATLKVPALSATWLVLIAVSGIILSGTWWAVIRSYRQLNSGKFKVIHKLERLLPVAPYEAEWIMLGEGKDLSQYLPLSHVEQVIPVVFLVINVCVLVTGLAS